MCAARAARPPVDLHVREGRAFGNPDGTDAAGSASRRQDGFMISSDVLSASWPLLPGASSQDLAARRAAEMGYERWGRRRGDLDVGAKSLERRREGTGIGMLDPHGRQAESARR